MLDRRAFLRRGARNAGGLAALGLVGPAVLQACHVAKAAPAASAPAGAAATALTTPPGVLGVLNFVGPWLPDVETAGEYIADTKGYWVQEGFSAVRVIPSGPGATPQEQMVETGQALVAVTSLDTAAAAVQKGFGISVIGAQYQDNPMGVTSPASKPLNTPHDLIGKRVGVQSANSSVWYAFLQANGIDTARVTTVPVGFDPSPLAQGAVDGWFSSIIGEPIVLQVDHGFATTTFLLSDFNCPEVGNAYICSRDALRTTRATLKAAMTGDILGWKEALAHPDEAARAAAIRAHGLDQRQLLLQAGAQAKLMTGRKVAQEGLFYVDPAFQAANVTTLSQRAISVTASQLFDMSLLDEIYQDKDLKAAPIVGTP